MDRILRPDRLEIEPNAPEASRTWRHWKCTFSNFISKLESGDVAPDKLHTLINFIGPHVYELIADVEDYDEAMYTLELAYDKPKNEIFARHLLSTCVQEPGQTLDQFLQKLQTLAKDCSYKSVSAEQHKDQAIRDAFIRGIQSNNIRQRLLEKTDLDLKTAFDNARSLEMAEKHSLSYNNHSFHPPSSAAVLQTEDDYEGGETTLAALPSNQKCYFCGYKRHPRIKCPAKDAVCKSCGKKGHFQKVCQSSGNLYQKSKQSVASTQAKQSLGATSASTTTTSLQDATINVTVAGKKFKALIDSGSTDSYVNSEIAKFHKWKIYPSNTIISMASMNLTKATEGHCLVNLTYKDKCYTNIKLSLLPNACSDIILGHDFINTHSLLQIHLSGKNPPLILCGVSAAKIEPPSIFSNLNPACKPIATKSRRHSKPDQIFIASEIDKLLKEDIIESSYSPWRAQVLVTSNENHKKRMVIDYSQTINKFTYLDAYPQKRLDTMIEEISQFKYFSALDLKSAYHQIPLKENEKAYTAFEAAGRLYQFKRVPFGVTNGVSCFQRVIDNIIEKENLENTFAYIDNVTVCGKDKESHDKNLQKLLKATSSYGITFNESKNIICVNEIDLLGYRVSEGMIRPDPERLLALENIQPPHSLKSQQRIVGMFSYYSQWIRQF